MVFVISILHRINNEVGEKMKKKGKDYNNFPFGWFGSPVVNKKIYWIFIAVLAAVEIGLGISIFFR
jgi:hypothetical protein